jgi:hypothetical protein
MWLSHPWYQSRRIFPNQCHMVVYMSCSPHVQTKSFYIYIKTQLICFFHNLLSTIWEENCSLYTYFFPELRSTLTIGMWANSFWPSELAALPALELVWESSSVPFEVRHIMILSIEQRILQTHIIYIKYLIDSVNQSYLFSSNISMVIESIRMKTPGFKSFTNVVLHTKPLENTTATRSLRSNHHQPAFTRKGIL